MLRGCTMPKQDYEGHFDDGNTPSVRVNVSS